MKKLLFFLCCVISFSEASSQTRYLSLPDFKFNGTTGQYRDDTTTTYSLLCTGKTNNDTNTDSLINVWLTAHPDASLRPVCSFSYNNSAAHRITFTYSWIVSNMATDPSLNIYLVRHGCSAANSMLWGKNDKVMQPDINYYKAQNSETKVFVDKKVYAKFVQELRKAASKQLPKTQH